MIERAFQNIPEGKLSEADQQPFLLSLGWSGGTTWQNLRCSRRVLIILEAGAGKTYECREQAQRLWDAEEPAFFVELAGLGAGYLRSLLDHDEEARLDAWLSCQSDVAAFFLDSIDELRLSPGVAFDTEATDCPCVELEQHGSAGAISTGCGIRPTGYVGKSARSPSAWSV